jgi:AraC-like DNA-binding protein
MMASVSDRWFFMSKNDIILTEHNFGHRNMEGESFRLHQTGRLNDMRNWQHDGLQGPFWRCYHHVRSGSAVRLRRRLIPLRTDEVVLIPENTSFDALGAARVDHFWIHFSPPIQVIFAPRLLRVSINPTLAGQLKEWRGLVSPSSSSRTNWRLFHTCLAVLHACFARVSLPTSPATSPALQRVLEEIENSLATPPGNCALARSAGRSVEGFNRWFRAETGTTPGRYVTGRRIREASRLLTLTDRSIEEVAESVGYTNRHHFTRVFTQHIGRPPAQFRGEQRKSG